jgi:competence protein ComEC
MPNTAQQGGGAPGLLLPVLAGAVLGPALQLQQPELWSAAVYAAFGLAALVALAWAAIKMRASGRRALLALLAALALTAATCGLRAQWFAASALNPALEGRDIAVTGLVAAMPQRNDVGLRFRLAVESAHMNGAEVALPPQLLLGWYGGASLGAGGAELSRQPAELRAGERWQMTVRLKAPHGNLNPHGFDYELWLWEQGIQATGYVRAGPRDAAPQRVADTWAHPVERARQAVRDAIFQRISDRKLAGVVAALVTGDQNAIDRADWDIFRATGVAHLMSISGLHVTMFAWAAAALVGALWRRSPRLCLALPAQHAGLLGGLLLAAGYALFSGWGVPAQRTVWMLATVGLLRLAGRRWPWPPVWLLACAVVVSIDPWALLQPGFWLSFVAVGVLFATDSGAPHAAPMRAGARFALMLREQWVVTLALTPLGLLLFGQVSLVGLVANLLAIPWVTLLVTPLALGGVLLAPLWDAAALAVQGLGAVLQAMTALPLATVFMAAPPLWAGAAGVLGGLVLALRWPWPLRVLGVPLLLPVLLWQAPRPAPGEFELLAADVGQGNAVLVRTASHTLVYDAGPRYSAEADAGHRVLVPLLRALGERVDTLVLSHRDSDHTGGAAAVLAMQPEAALLASIEPTHELQALRPATRCEAGQRWQWDGVQFEVLHPQPADYERALKPNALSCVLRVANGAQAALLPGDIEQPQEAALVAAAATGGLAADALRADWLLVPHHGSKTSSSDAFLAAVQPRLAVVQAGYRNRFGHPAEPVLARYQARGAEVVDTARCGAAWWRSTQPQQVECQRRVGPRYWHHRLP